VSVAVYCDKLYAFEGEVHVGRRCASLRLVNITFEWQRVLQCVAVYGRMVYVFDSEVFVDRRCASLR